MRQTLCFICPLYGPNFSPGNSRGPLETSQFPVELRLQFASFVYKLSNGLVGLAAVAG
jgi:hypothetical protein